jgi:pSer/pThr/pTyr-binding forkhead associated (FHA) protein
LQYPPQQPPAYSPATSADQRSAESSADISGKLVLKSTQAVITLPAGKSELLLGRTDPVQNIFPDIDLTAYGGDKGGVSRSHARMSQSGPQLFLEDLNSTNFTFINQSKLDPGQRYPVSDGDEIRLGLIVMEYRTG